MILKIIACSECSITITCQGGDEMTVYITSTGSFLPGPAIEVDQVENVLGAVNGKPSSLRVQIQKANKIETRHYAIDEQQQTTHSNTEMATNAAELTPRPLKKRE